MSFGPLGGVVYQSQKDIGNGRSLFEAHPFFSPASAYDVTPDGKRFIMVTAGEANPATINLVVNWTADLKRN